MKMMNYINQHKAWAILLIVSLLFSCSTSKVVVMHQDVAAKAEAEGNFTAATTAWNAYFDQKTNKKEEVEPANYSHAAKTAVKANKIELAESWFSLARSTGYSDPEMQLVLADLYKGKNQITKEKAELETYLESYPDHGSVDLANARLFEIYSVMGDDAKAAQQWPKLSEQDRHAEKYLDPYFKIVLRGDDNQAIDAIANDLLVANPNHEKALEWVGEYYYHKAENSYQKELKAYKKTHTHLQYLKLNKALKVINADFKKSLDCFLKLWEIEQKEVYASYMSNIYTRFENSQKADYYRKFVK